MGTLALVTAPIKEPVALDELRRHLRIDTTDHDLALAKYLKAARVEAEGYTRRALITQTWDYKLDCWEYPIRLPIQPVQSVTSITYTGETGTTATLATSQYSVKGAAADGLCFIEPAYNVTWPTLREVSYPITIRFVAGYGLSDSAVPEPIRIALMLRVEMLFDRDTRTQELLNDAATSLLDLYRVLEV